MPLLTNCFIILLIVLGIIISIALNRPLARVLEDTQRKIPPKYFILLGTFMLLPITISFISYILSRDLLFFVLTIVLFGIVYVTLYIYNVYLCSLMPMSIYGRFLAIWGTMLVASFTLFLAKYFPQNLLTQPIIMTIYMFLCSFLLCITFIIGILLHKNKGIKSR
uniref:Uncharacterized protein n=1 Tax=Thermosporothrix sp. COM3 TaxID=2490863 RepID=A0A455SIB8_9CHLR|nr:hypothetical protein KTC_20610 [Thermosporothrix sp. COM3]